MGAFAVQSYNYFFIPQNFSSLFRPDLVFTPVFCDCFLIKLKLLMGAGFAMRYQLDENNKVDC